MDFARRSLLRAGLGFGAGLGLLATGAARAQYWGDPPTPAKGDPEAPAWPPAERIPLWPKAPPGAPARLPKPNWTMNGVTGSRQLWIRGVPMPELNIFRPAEPNGTALLCLPGGSYEFLSVQNEGMVPAQLFNRHGVTVFVLTYRLPAEGWAERRFVPLQDAQRAMRLIRARASSFAVDPARLGVIGFSAGGHLAGDITTEYDRTVYARVDEADRQSARPDFSALIYPVASLRRQITHAGSRDNLLGPDSSEALADSRSPAHNVNSDTPPSFIMHSIDDETVPVDCAFDWISACRAAKVPVEAHLFEKGGHGYGVGLPADMPASRWPDLMVAWMRQRKVG